MADDITHTVTVEVKAGTSYTAETVTKASVEVPSIDGVLTALPAASKVVAEHIARILTPDLDDLTGRNHLSDLDGKGEDGGADDR